MANRIKKYNPAFLTTEELVRSFVVRHTELDLIMQVIRENVTQSNQHIIVIGPRGIGKTMVVLRVVEKIREEEDLRERWYPLVFGEESYQVSSPGEFWLEALFHLAHKTGNEQWGRTFEELRDEIDEERLHERALAQLMDFADAEGKRILLVVENFNMLVGEQISDSDAWKLRHTLLNEPRVMLLATATSRFEEIENADKAMFELFKLYELKALDERECGTLWASITEKEATEERVRPLQILTGGNPRLLAIISIFAAKMSLKELMGDLMQLVDDNTEYFKSHLDSLPAIERKVYLALAELWDPATARKVADSARLNVNKASSLLRRLMKRGMVVEADGDRRTKLYQVAERMYNIYYLMRRRGAPSRRVRGLVRFMVPFYGPKELVGLTRRIAEEACELGPELCKDHYMFYEGILESTSIQSLRKKIIKAAPHAFFEIPDIPDSIKCLVEREKPKELEAVEAEIVELLKEGKDLEKVNKLEEAEHVYRKALELEPENALVWGYLGKLLHEDLERYEEAEEAYRRAVELKPDFHWAWEQFGLLLHKHLGRYEEAEKAYRRAAELGPTCFVVWEHLGQLLHKHLHRYDEAESAYRTAIRLKPDSDWAWGHLGLLLRDEFERYEEAEDAYRKAIELRPDYAWVWAHLGLLLHMLDREEEAEAAYRKAIGIDEKYPCPWLWLGILLHESLERYEEAEAACRKAIKKHPECSWAWEQLSHLLHEHLEHYEEAEAAYRTSIQLSPDAFPAWHGLIRVLFDKLRQPKKATEVLREYLEKTEMVEKTVNSTTELFVHVAAAGYGREALKILVESPSAEILEPLVVGLRMYVGEDVKVAAEIMEVGKDVVKRIEERRKKIQAEPDSEERPRAKAGG